MRYLGVDFGLKGALASLSETGEILQLTKMPLLENGSVDALGVMIWLADEEQLAEANGEELVIYGENLHSIFGTSAGSNFTFAKNIGKVLGAIECAQINYFDIRAIDWQSHIFEALDVPEMGDMKTTKKGKVKYKRLTKLMAEFAFDALFPHYENKTNDGERDACLIAEFARRTHKQIP